jgi:hypothetical protein
MRADFSVVAIVAAHNEADVIGHVVGDLIEQGIDVYLLDDGSTDGTTAAVARHLGRGLLAIERLSASEDATGHLFEWERILKRKEEIAGELAADWFLHHDADEFRESPWSHLRLKDAIQHVDSLGYNAIDFAGLDFWPVDERFHPGEDVRRALTSYTEPAAYDRVQVRCWKRVPVVDLASTGGHEARFPGRRVFPLRFVLRHYPIRGTAQAARKVRERMTRTADSERARGWHRQYDALAESGLPFRDPSTLTPYDPDAVRRSIMLQLRRAEDSEDIDRLTAAVTRAREEVATLCQRLQAHGADIERLNQSLAHARAALHAKEAETAGIRAALDETRAELDARLRDISALRMGLDERAAESERWRATVDGLSVQAKRLTDRIHALESSLSWRWTAPLRRMVSLFRGR